MNIYTRTSGIAAAIALMAAPACAAGAPAGNANGNPSAAGKAYGSYCKTESKKRSDAAPGTKGSPFSQCVTAMAKLANAQTKSPRQACKALSKKHSDAAPGTHGSPFSQCVSGGAKLLRQLKNQDQQSSGDQSTDTSQEQTSTS